jgi:hypothetical protein
MIFVLLFGVISVRGVSGPLCVGGTVAALVAAGPCDIDNLQFTFGNITGEDVLVGDTIITTYNNSDFSIDPTATGFNLIGPGPVTAGGTTNPEDNYAYLSYQVTALAGTITGVGASGGALYATPISDTQPAYSFAYYLIEQEDASGNFQQSLTAVNDDPGGGLPTTIGTLGSYTEDTGPIASTLAGYAYAFDLFAQASGPQASYDGSAVSYTFTTSIASSSPEPSSIFLFLSGALVVAFMASKRTQRSAPRQPVESAL